MSQKELKSMLVEDDASKFLESLPQDQRKPQYVRNKLPPSPPSFSDEERKAAFGIFIPAEK